MQCPQCGGDMWDQNKSKFPKKPNGPDFKCKNKDCVDENGYTTAVWLEKKPFQGFQGTQTGTASEKPMPIKTVTQDCCKDPKVEMMRLAYRKDLMVALVDKFSESATSNDILEMFRLYWSEVEK